jgi:hypothetical protein
MLCINLEDMQCTMHGFNIVCSGPMQKLEQECGSGHDSNMPRNQVAHASTALICVREYVHHHSATLKTHGLDQLMQALTLHAVPPAVSAVMRAVQTGVSGILSVIKVPF